MNAQELQQFTKAIQESTEAFKEAVETLRRERSMVKYALAWLRGAMMYAPIKTYSRSFVQVVIETLWVVETWNRYHEP